METKTGFLQVPDASLYYQICGNGPPLLIIAGGSRNAEGSNYAMRLINRFTVITYDRRGLSRSKIERVPENWSLEMHSDDAARLLEALVGGPALVSGVSIGASIGLGLATRHPELVRALMAHEPPLPYVLPEPERTSATQALEDAEEIFRREGLPAVSQKFMAMLGLNPEDREPEVEWPPQQTAQAAADGAFWITHDNPAVRRYRLDTDALRAAPVRVVLGTGRANRDNWIHHCVDSLAAALGTEPIEFPGGHYGAVTHPKAFSERLLEAFDIRFALAPKEVRTGS